MSRPLVLPLQDCTNPGLVGGKAVGLARLLAVGFRVPPGICVTTEAYQDSLHSLDIAPKKEWCRLQALPPVEQQAAFEVIQSRLRDADLSALATHCTAHLQNLPFPSETRWAVRSSATNEDAGRTSFAGLYQTHLGVPMAHIAQAIKELWASVWGEQVLSYLCRRGSPLEPPAMAVVIQPMIAAQMAGVAYSIHPVTGRSNQVVVNSVLGLAAPFADGHLVPDQFIVAINADLEPVGIRTRTIAEKTARLLVTEHGLQREMIPQADRAVSSLSDEQLFQVGRLTKQIERGLGHPVDVEWAYDEHELWIVQARSITGSRPAAELINEDCEWSRTNFKETMPEVPSPLGISFLEYFMETYIVSQYRRLGCRVPDGVSAVRVVHGRPYLNVSLFYSLVGQLGGDASLNSLQMGGQPLRLTPMVTRLKRATLVRAWWLLWRELRRVEQKGPTWFAEMERNAAHYAPRQIQSLPLEALAGELDSLGRWLDGHEVTFGIAAGVGQALQTLIALLPKWLGSDWQRLLNAALQGQGTVISAQQIMRLAEVVQSARHELVAHEWFLADPWDASCYRERLAGTDFLRCFEAFLQDYGHRAVGESDIMSPRMAEQPESVLTVVRSHLQAPTGLGPSEVLARQTHCRRAALGEIRRRFAWRWDRWLVFRWWYGRLTRFFALREANRHHLMKYSTAARHLLLRIGERLVEEGRLDAVHDIFFVTLEERNRLLAGAPGDWKAVAGQRRAEWQHDAEMPAPDTIRDWNLPADGGPLDSRDDRVLYGLPISVGRISGAVRLVLSSADWPRVKTGDILVAPVIDPGMAPLLGIAGGVIVEMGGMLSHGAIIAREYGLPTIVNVERALTRLTEGAVVTVDANAGTIMMHSPL